MIRYLHSRAFTRFHAICTVALSRYLHSRALNTSRFHALSSMQVAVNAFQQPPQEAQAQPLPAPAARPPVDEIGDFADAQETCSGRAAHQLLGFQLIAQHPPTETLDVHTETDRTVCFTKAQGVKAALQGVRPSKLQAFFALCKAGSQPACTLLYRDVPKYYRWVSEDAEWRPRAATSPAAIGRIYTVNPGTPPRSQVHGNVGAHMHAVFTLQYTTPPLRAQVKASAFTCACYSTTYEARSPSRI